MSVKIYQSKEQARESILKGFELVAQFVGTTLGPKGRNIAIGRNQLSPRVTHDGVTVAREFEVEDPFVNVGVQLIKQAAQRANDEGGDGTTTATILAHSILNEALKAVSSGANAMMVKKGIEKATELLIKEIDASSRKVSGDDEIKQIATISAGDSFIGGLIAEGIKKLGEDGILTVDNSDDFETKLDFKDGVEFDRGYITNHFINNQSRASAELDDCLILITDYPMTQENDILPLLMQVVSNKTKNLLVIAERIEGVALPVLVVNKLQGKVNSVAVTTPEFGDRRKDFLGDLAILTGGTYISQESGKKLSEVSIDDLGKANKVIVVRDGTLIVGGQGDKKEINKRIAEVRAEQKRTKSEFDKEKIGQRLNRLKGVVGILKVYASNEVELREIKWRVEDAINATKAAIEKGIVPGGEMALIDVADSLKKIKPESEDEKIGINIVRTALYKPFEILMRNSGSSKDEGIYKIQLEKLDIQANAGVGTKVSGYGIDVIDGQVKDLIKAGIIDPAKVTMSALRHASSIAIMGLTIDGIINDKPQVENSSQPQKIDLSPPEEY